MILSGEKKEEYREIKPYYTNRFIKLLGFPKTEISDVLELLEETETLKSFEFSFRNGYRRTSPIIKVKCSLSIGYGKLEWGALPGVKYYRLHLKEVVTV